MMPLYQDPWFTFCFADDRLIPRFHLEGIEVGRRVWVFRIDPGTGERLGLLATATVGEGGWGDLTEPIVLRAGDVSCGVPDEAGRGRSDTNRWRRSPCRWARTRLRPGRRTYAIGNTSSSNQEI